jgi:hypothetical protein
MPGYSRAPHRWDSTVSIAEKIQGLRLRCLTQPAAGEADTVAAHSYGGGSRDHSRVSDRGYPWSLGGVPAGVYRRARPHLTPRAPAYLGAPAATSRRARRIAGAQQFRRLRLADQLRAHFERL